MFKFSILAIFATLAGTAAAQLPTTYRWRVDHPSAWTEEVVASPDGVLVATAMSNYVYVWHAASGTLINRIGDPYRSVSSIAFGPDSRTLAIGLYDDYLMAADAYSGAIKWRYDVLYDPIDVKVSRDGQRVYYCDTEGYVGAVSGTGRPVFRVRPSTDRLNALALSAGSEYVAVGGEDRMIRVLRASDGLLRYTMDGQGSTITDLAYGSDTRTVFASDVNGYVKKWTVLTNASSNVYAAPYDDIRAISVSSDGAKIAVAQWGGGLRVMNPAGATISSFDTPSGNQIYGVAFLGTAKVVTMQEDDRLRVREVSAGMPIRVEAGFAYEDASRIAVSPDGLTLAVNGNREVTYFNSSTGQIVRTDPAPAYANAIEFSPKGTYVAYGLSNDRLLVRKTADFSNKWDLTRVDMGQVRDVAFSPDETMVASASDDKSVRVWKMTDGTLLTTLNHADNTDVYRVAFSPNGKWLASGDRSGFVKIWRLSAGTFSLVSTSSSFSQTIQDLAFSADSAFLAVALNDTVAVLNTDTGTLRSNLPADGTVTSVGFSPDGSRVVGSTNYGYRLRFWAFTGAGTQTDLVVERPLRSAAFLPKGDGVAVLLDNGGLAVVGSPAKPYLSNLVPLSMGVYGGSWIPVSVGASTAVSSSGLYVSLYATPSSLVVTPSLLSMVSGYPTTEYWIRVAPVNAPTTVKLIAKDGITSLESPLVILPPELAGAALTTGKAKGGTTISLRISLNAPAGPSGTVVTLRSTSANAVVPATVTIPAGTTEATVPVTTTAVTANTAVTISALLRYTTFRNTLVLTP